MRIQWELIGSNRRGRDDAPPGFVWRAEVPQGWLVFAESGTAGGSGLTFVPDPGHIWVEKAN